MNRRYYALLILFCIAAANSGEKHYAQATEVKESSAGATKLLVAEGAKVAKLAGGFGFTEGPAADTEGNIFFTDIPNNRIHKWSTSGVLSTFLENSERANGLFFDKNQNLIMCQGKARCLALINHNGQIKILAEEYAKKRFNSPNDLWADPNGGIYFTDPRYGKRLDMEQDGEHVYYLSPDRKRIIRVIDDMVRPNGIVGTVDGKKLYVADHGGDKTYRYNINPDGTLSNKKLFAQQGSDGMTIDAQGNIYLTGDDVSIYEPTGKKIASISVPEKPSNVCFGGKDRDTLFITARSSIYSIPMPVKGL